MFTPLALWSTLAGAADLTLTASFPDVAPRTVTLTDVEEVDPPAIVFEEAEGRRWSVSLRVTPVPDGSRDVAAVIERLDRDRRGRLTATPVLQPTLRMQPGQPGEVFTGRSIPIADSDPQAWREEGIRLHIVVE